MDERRRKLKFRAWRRGFREMDLLMGAFADAYIENFSETELDEFEALLAIPDWDVYSWITEEAQAPANLQGEVLSRLIAFRPDPQPG